MALFYKRIKGCGADAQYSLTYLTFSANPNTHETVNGVDFISLEHSPLLSRSYTEKGTPTLTDYGYLLTSQMNKPVISFNQTCTFKAYSGTNTPRDVVTFNYDGLTLGGNASIVGNSTFKGGKTTFAHNVTISNNAILHADSYIEALYFNATSDQRAKENIQPLTASCLNIVKNLPIYTFDYKFDGSHSIGVMAQEAEEIDLGDFNLVNDNDSNGIDRFKTVKETKLTYVLWKAVQELTDEVEQLKAELAQMKEGR